MTERIIPQGPVTGLTARQYEVLVRPLNGSRVASRNQGGKSLSYLESWDVRAHLIRVFGYGNFDVRTLSTEFTGAFEYTSGNGKDMVEVVYRATVELVVRSESGYTIATYSESAVGSATGGRGGAGIGDLHDNALKSATSDAMKRCAINLGTQFGLSLYDNGNRNDVVKSTLVKPYDVEEPEVTPEQKERLAASVGQGEKAEA